LAQERRLLGHQITGFPQRGWSRVDLKELREVAEHQPTMGQGVADRADLLTAAI
jgi:hypothetical protein